MIPVQIYLSTQIWHSMSVHDSTRMAAAAAAAALGAAAYVYGRQKRISHEEPADELPEPTEAWHRFDELAEHGVSRRNGTELGLALAGTVLLCTQNLAVSGANQVLLNLVEGAFWSGPIVLLSPSIGPFAKEFADLGVAVFIGSLEALLARVSDIRLAVCNTIMTADLVVALEARGLPTIWVLHELWPPGVLEEELAKRNYSNTTAEVVARALPVCRCTVSVCAAQRALYGPAHGVVTFVGVPEPEPDWMMGAEPSDRRPLTVLCLGILCPRKNQHWAVEVFREFAGDRRDVRLLVVGARYVRQYEIDYVDKVKAAAGGDPRIEVRAAVGGCGFEGVRARPRAAQRVRTIHTACVGLARPVTCSWPAGGRVACRLDAHGCPLSRQLSQPSAPRARARPPTLLYGGAVLPIQADHPQTHAAPSCTCLLSMPPSCILAYHLQAPPPAALIRSTT